MSNAFAGRGDNVRRAGWDAEGLTIMEHDLPLTDPDRELPVHHVELLVVPGVAVRWGLVTGGLVAFDEVVAAPGFRMVR